MRILESIRRLFRKQPDAHRDGLQLVSASDRRLQEKRELTQDQRQRVHRLQEVLAEPYPISRGDWIAGFEADRDPEGEVQIIEAVAVTYESAVRGASLDAEEKQSLYQTLCVLSCNPDNPPDCGIPKLSSQWVAIVESYREARATGSRP